YPLVGSKEKFQEVGSTQAFKDIDAQVRPLHYADLYQLYEHIQEKTGRQPYVVLADEMLANPQETLTELYNYLNIPFTKKCLSWPAYDETFSFETAWQDSKSASSCLHWHDRAITSTGFDKP